MKGNYEYKGFDGMKFLDALIISKTEKRSKEMADVFKIGQKYGLTTFKMMAFLTELTDAIKGIADTEAYKKFAEEKEANEENGHAQ